MEAESARHVPRAKPFREKLSRGSAGFQRPRGRHALTSEPSTEAGAGEYGAGEYGPGSTGVE